MEIEGYLLDFMFPCRYRAEWLRYQEQLEEVSDMNRTLKLEISVHETLSSEKPGEYMPYIYTVDSRYLDLAYLE